MIRAVCIGEAMVELREAGPSSLTRAVAGDAYNTAVYLHRSLGPAGDVAFLTVIGEDPLSDTLARDFLAQGLDPRWVWRMPDRLPGLYLIQLDAHGDRAFHYWRADSAARLWLRRLAEAGGVEALAGVDLVFLSGVSLAILSPEDRAEALEMMAALKGRVGRLAFDPNVRPRLWRGAAQARADLERACGLADIVLASRDDGDWLWGDTDPARQIARLRALGCQEAVITLGADGVIGDAADVAWSANAPRAVARVADTSGAGDSFNGGYLAARLRGAAPRAAAAAGQAVAARVVTAPGALVAPDISHPSTPHRQPDPS